jgi:hypothetical protein
VRAAVPESSSSSTSVSNTTPIRKYISPWTTTDEDILGGQIAAFPFCGFLADGYGRRICIFVGCALVLVGKSCRLPWPSDHMLTKPPGTAVQTTAHTTGHFIGGRFVLGFGGECTFYAPNMHFLTCYSINCLRCWTSVHCRTCSPKLPWNNGWNVQQL